MPYPTSRIFPLNRGLHLGFPPHRLPPGFSPNINNTRIKDAVLGKRPGTRSFNGSTPLVGTIVSAFQYRRETGTIENIVITGGATLAERRFYKSSAGSWSDITDAQLTDGDGPVDPDMRGTALEPYDATIAPSSTQVDVFYASNGNNAAIGTNPEILKWDGIAATAVAMTTGPGSCRTMTTYANRLILGYIYDGAQYRGNRVQWSKEGDAENWSDPTSGLVDLIESSDLITRLSTLRGRLVIYKEGSIIIGQETGYPTIPIAFSYLSKDVGAIAGFSVAQAADNHFFLAQDNIYAFDGVSIRPIGNPIKKALRNINAGALRQVFSMVDYFAGEYWLFVPEGAETQPTHAWVYNWLEDHWTRWTMPTGVTCGSRGVTGTGLTWDTIAGLYTWDTIPGTWDDYTVVGAPTLFLSMADKTTDEITIQTSNDGAAGIDAFWESADTDFADQPGPDNTPISTADLKTLSRIEVRYHGAGAAPSLYCEVSMDGGASYRATSPNPAITSTSDNVVYFDTWLTGSKFRVRLGNRTAGQGLPGLEEIILHYLPRGRQI